MRTKIIYEDDDIIVVHKPAGLATQTSKLGQQDVVSEMKNHIAREATDATDTAEKNTPGRMAPYIALINRLDQPVEGIVLLAKNDRAARGLSEQIQKNQMQKSYYAAIAGVPVTMAGTLIDHLRKNIRTNLSQVVEVPQGQKPSKDVKRGELSYHCVKTVENSMEIGMECVKYTSSILDIQLKTGRHHQIRVQMAHAGMPLLGDGKYGSHESKELSQKLHLRNVALCAYHLTFQHPILKKEMDIIIEPDNPLLTKGDN